MTVERTPSTSRQRRWLSSLSKPASASTRSQVTRKDAWAMAGRNGGESLDGPRLTVAAARKWLWVSQTVVSLVQAEALCLRPERLKK